RRSGKTPQARGGLTTSPQESKRPQRKERTIPNHRMNGRRKTKYYNHHQSTATHHSPSTECIEAEGA
ncbi:hypothetical protein, partial [Rossellomorea marisflavi]|uniref:hypothetical protein n=1 Tax=Rossellomorea marisflavi TaxID=189381 RepID=UPI003D2EB61C